MADYDIAVIGGGLIGCASAYYLAKSAARVVVLERGQINQGASGQNAGSLHFQLEHRLIQDLEVNVRELEYYVGLARLSIGLWQGIDAELGCDSQLSMQGGLMVAETPAEMALLERKLQIEQSQGLSVELLDGAAARTLAPYLSKDIQAALYCASEGHCNPRLLTPAYARKAVGLGASLITDATVREVRRTGGKWHITFRDSSGERQQIRCGAVLNAAGASAMDIAAMANLHVPLFPVGLTMNATEKTEPQISHLIQHVGRKLSLKQTEEGNLLIGGGWRAQLRQRGGRWSNAESPGIILDSVIGNLRTAAEIVPMVRSLRLLRTWTGTTAITADQLPVLGEVPQAPGFFVAAGGSGFTYGPAYALLMSELMLTGTSSYPLTPFSPARFNGLNAFMGQ